MAKFNGAIALISERRQQAAKQLAAMEAEAQYSQAQIDYDLLHRPENKKDIPGFRKRLNAANENARELRVEIDALDAALAVLKEADRG